MGNKSKTPTLVKNYHLCLECEFLAKSAKKSHAIVKVKFL